MSLAHNAFTPSHGSVPPPDQVLSLDVDDLADPNLPDSLSGTDTSPSHGSTSSHHDEEATGLSLDLQLNLNVAFDLQHEEEKFAEQMSLPSDRSKPIKYCKYQLFGICKAAVCHHSHNIKECNYVSARKMNASPKDMDRILKLVENNPQIEHLNFGRNQLVSKKVAHDICKILASEKHTIRSLALDSTFIGRQGFQQILECARHLPHLTYLDLSDLNLMPTKCNVSFKHRSRSNSKKSKKQRKQTKQSQEMSEYQRKEVIDSIVNFLNVLPVKTDNSPITPIAAEASESVENDANAVNADNAQNALNLERMDQMDDMNELHWKGNDFDRNKSCIDYSKTNVQHLILGHNDFNVTECQTIVYAGCGYGGLMTLDLYGNRLTDEEVYNIDKLLYKLRKDRLMRLLLNKDNLEVLPHSIAVMITNHLMHEKQSLYRCHKWKPRVDKFTNKNAAHNSNDHPSVAYKRSL